MRIRDILVASALTILCAANPAHAVQMPSPTDLRLVVIVSRHGVRSPTDPAELTAYAAKPWPAWQVPPGHLTPNGATMMTYFGASYRSFYALQGLWSAGGCPGTDRIYVWTDVDQRTKATGAALLDGLAPACGFVARDTGSGNDPIFHALPEIGKADAATAAASLTGSVGTDPAALAAAYGLAFAKLDKILGCAAGSGCQPVSEIPMTIATSPKTGLASVAGSVDLASTAVEDFILAYADGKPMNEVGWGAVDRATLLQLSQLHTLKFLLNTEPPYIARAQGSNLLSHLAATIDQGATGVKNEKTNAPLAAKFVAFVGHDTNLESLAGMLHLRWLVPGYQFNDTPPGSALVFEVHQPPAGGTAFVRTFFTAQSLDQMRSLSNGVPARVSVFVPGCPNLDCPLATFDRIVSAAIDPAFVK